MNDYFYLVLFCVGIYLAIRLWGYMQEYETRRYHYEQRHNEDDLFKDKKIRRVAKHEQKVGYCKQ